jgi:hypothetical protein
MSGLINRRILPAYIDNTNERPGRLFDGLVIVLVISDSSIVIFNGLVWIPATILKSMYGSPPNYRNDAYIHLGMIS